jgi:hypothetical protein
LRPIHPTCWWNLFFFSLFSMLCVYRSDDRHTDIAPCCQLLQLWHISTWLLFFALWFCCSGFYIISLVPFLFFVFFFCLSPILSPAKNKKVQENHGRCIHIWQFQILEDIACTHGWAIPKTTTTWKKEKSSLTSQYNPIDLKFLFLGFVVDSSFFFRAYQRQLCIDILKRTCPAFFFPSFPSWSTQLKSSFFIYLYALLLNLAIKETPRKWK